MRPPATGGDHATRSRAPSPAAESPDAILDRLPKFFASRPLVKGEWIDIELTTDGVRLVEIVEPADTGDTATPPLTAAPLSDTTGAT